jgi:hypothetical protein
MMHVVMRPTFAEAITALGEVWSNEDDPERAANRL